MRILVTGGRGQLGRSLAARAEVTAVDVDAVDITDADAVARAVAGYDVVINGAAYTNVDRAETDRDRAYGVNRDGAANLARACGARLLHVSTNYVFDGAAGPYREDDAVHPLNVYGASKADGERAVHDAGGTVVRTSWLFGEGGPSFVHSILALASERPELRIVADQHGCPTYAGDLADALLALARHRDRAPTYHYCNDGATTWHGFAEAIVAEAHLPVAVVPIATTDYATPARRPANGVLDTSRIRALGIVPPSWRAGLARVVAEARRG